MRLEGKIAFTSLPVPPLDLDLLPPATAFCGLVQISEGGSAKWRSQCECFSEKQYVPSET